MSKYFAELGQCVRVESVACIYSEIESSYNEHGKLCDQIAIVRSCGQTYLAPTDVENAKCLENFLKSSLFTKEIERAGYIKRGNKYRVNNR